MQPEHTCRRFPPPITMTSRKTSDETRSNVYISFPFLCLPNNHFLVPFALFLFVHDYMAGTHFSCAKNWCRAAKKRGKNIYVSTLSSRMTLYIRWQQYWRLSYSFFPIVICMTRTVSHKYPDRPMNLAAMVLLPSSGLHSLEKYESWNTFIRSCSMCPSRWLASLPRRASLRLSSLGLLWLLSANNVLRLIHMVRFGLNEVSHMDDAG